MVMNSSNRSPSPISMRSSPNPNPNPNSRSDQEREGVGVRKSFSGYTFAKSAIVTNPRSFTPNTPANSPAEYARSSFGRECGNSFGDHEQKENERDPNSKPVGRVRSPSISKGTKHFMSPTISAASKINPSPRKKVLGERNEAIRTSASLSDGRFHFFSTSSLEFADENESKTDTEAPPCSMISDFSQVGNEVSYTDLENKVADLSPGVGKIESEPDLVVLSPEIPLNTTKKSETLPQSDMPKIVADDNEGLDVKNSVASSPSVIAPLDADPFHSPYDPKTNFLSPRPQFLHYKPNPRIESYISQGLRLKEDFTSDSVSETENSDEVQSETSLEVHEDSSSSVGTSPIEDQPTSSESSSSKSQELEEIAESIIDPRRALSGKWKSVTFLILILLGSISFSMYSHGVGNAIKQEKLFSQIYSNSRIAADVAKANFNGLFLNAKVLSAQSVGYLSQMIFQAREVKFSPIPYCNLTGWQEEATEDYLVKGFEFRSWLDRKEDGSQEKVAETDIFGDAKELRKLENYEAEKLEQSAGLFPLTDQVIEEYEPAELEESSVPEDSVTEDENAIVEMTEVVSLFDEPQKPEESRVLIDEISAVEMTEEASLLDKSENQETEQNHEDYDMVSAVQHSSQSNMKALDQQSTVSSDVLSQLTTANAPFSDAVFESESVEEVKSVSDSLVLEAAEKISQILEATERSLAPATAAISLVVVSLLAATIFMFVKKPKDETSTPSADNVVHKENSTFIPVASKPDPKVHENTSWSGPVEVDMVGESCPSELSSFQKTASYYKRGNDEAQSMEKSSKRNHKRESLASSSSEYTMSASYGSFTTYSIVHSKQRDDEVVTPVRRSSRIRSKVTSP